MIKIEYDRFIDPVVCAIPDYAVPYLVNGDADNLSEEDISIIDNWVEAMSADGYNVTIFSPVDDAEENFYEEEDCEPSFVSCPEFGLAADCYNLFYCKGIRK